MRRESRLVARSRVFWVEKRMGKTEQSSSESMTWLGKARIFSAMVAVVAALAWITGTNHCVLGLMRELRDPAASVSQCPGHPKASGCAHDGVSGMLACCQGLLSPNFEVAKTKVPFPVLVAMQLFAIGHITLPEDPKIVLPSTEYDTGPPSASFFVGTVLRRSLPENAPPLAS
jgi:hypothetical protein